MNPFKFKFLILGVLVLVAQTSAYCQSVSLDSGTFTLNNADNATPLATGDVFQFGYYTGATSTLTPFAGTFVALTSSSTFTPTFIGEETSNFAGPGQFSYDSFSLNVPSNLLPANGTIMSFMIYNSTTVSSATDYAAAADLSFPWSYASGGSVQPLPQGFSLSDPNVVWKNGDVGYTAIPLSSGTSLPIPEPQTNALLGAGFLLLAGWHLGRRKAVLVKTR